MEYEYGVHHTHNKAQFDPLCEWRLPESLVFHCATLGDLLAPQSAYVVLWS